MDKVSLREIYLQKRKQLSSREIHCLSVKIAKRVLPLLKDEAIVSVFFPIKKHNEVNTWLIVNQLKASNVRVSKSNFADHSMELYVFEGSEQLTENIWGIPEPAFGKKIENNEIDIVLVPLLIADKFGNRVGYGKGFYDRLLNSCRADAIKIGLNFFDPIDSIDGVLPTDVKLDFCVCPNKTYTF
jgi:5-formyltetrahydrofolate cyclo-ligase